MTYTTPNPGSPDAIKQGCTCPIHDNHNGKGATNCGTQCWWVDGNCPMHGFLPPKEEEPNPDEIGPDWYTEAQEGYYGCNRNPHYNAQPRMEDL